MTQREFFNAMTGYADQEEGRERRELTRLRWQTCWIVNCFVTEKLKPKDLLLLDEEVEEAEEIRKNTPLPTKEDFEKIKRQYRLK